MKIAYFDCFAGISGDMTLGALVDSGVSIDAIENELKKIKLQGYALKVSTVKRSGIAGTKVDVHIEKPSTHNTTHREIRDCIEKSTLAEQVKVKSLRVFEKIAEAEAKIHNVPVDDVHFHEVGAIDSIVDIVGSVIGIDLLGVDKIVSSPVNTGSGMVSTRHGKFPVPAPATVELLKDISCYSNGEKAELTTPTGAAIISSFADECSALPLMKITAIGYGAGNYNPEKFPNMLRLLIGSDMQRSEDLIMLETNIDDMNPEFYEYVFEKGFRLGALDIFITPIIMKKGRPAAILSILTEKNNSEKLMVLLFHETSSFGVRVNQIKRVAIEREEITVSTRFGDIRVKKGNGNGPNSTVSPEYDDCKSAAEKFGIPIKEVYNEVVVQERKRRLK